MATTLTVNRYTIGALVRSSAVFRDSVSGVVVDPTAVLFRVRKPNGTVISYTYLTDVQLVRDSAGNYHVDLNADSAAIWRCRWYSTGTGQAAAEDDFVVDASKVY